MSETALQHSGVAVAVVMVALAGLCTGVLAREFLASHVDQA